jgi:hypothetical protein
MSGYVQPQSWLADATPGHVQRRFELALQARGRRFEPCCAHCFRRPSACCGLCMVVSGANGEPMSSAHDAHAGAVCDTAPGAAGPGAREPPWSPPALAGIDWPALQALASPRSAPMECPSNRPSAQTCPPVMALCRAASVVGIGEGGLAIFVERADALDSVGMDGGAPVCLHHDRDGLLDRLALAHPDRLLDGLYRGG